jgi:hypothetical protein
MAISRGLTIKQLISTIICLLLPISLQGCTNRSSIRINPFINNFAEDQQAIQRAYDQSLASTYLAVLGSELPRPLFLNGYWKFLNSIISRSGPDVFQGRLTSLGYFAAPTLTTLKKYCTDNNPYLGAMIIRRQKVEESSAPCVSKSKSLRIPIGHSLRGFIIPKSNNFATVIPLDILAELSRKRSQIYWSDINPAWPRRPIQWVFSSQTNFKDDLRILGITPPSQYLLADDYVRGFMNIREHPYSLLFSPTTPSLASLLRGAELRLLPVQTTRNGNPIKPEPEELERYPRELVRTIYLYINEGNPNSCIMFDFADFVLANNKQLMHENNFVPLRQNEITKTLQQLRERRSYSSQRSLPFCSAFQASLDQTNQLAQPTKP